MQAVGIKWNKSYLRAASEVSQLGTAFFFLHNAYLICLAGQPNDCPLETEALPTWMPEELGSKNILIIY
jgi:hypothetical protein